MRSRVFSRLALVGWQAAAAVLAFTGQVDQLLLSWANPAWLAMLLAIILTPSRWIVVAALALAAGLVIWAVYDRRRHHQIPQ